MTWILGVNKTLITYIGADTRVTWPGEPNWKTEVQKVNGLAKNSMGAFAGSVVGGLTAMEELRRYLGTQPPTFDLAAMAPRLSLLLRKTAAHLKPHWRGFRVLVAALDSADSLLPGHGRTILCRMGSPEFVPEINFGGTMSLGSGSADYQFTESTWLGEMPANRHEGILMFVTRMQSELALAPRHDVGPEVIVATLDKPMGVLMARVPLDGKPPVMITRTVAEFKALCGGNKWTAAEAVA